MTKDIPAASDAPDDFESLRRELRVIQRRQLQVLKTLSQLRHDLHLGMSGLRDDLLGSAESQHEELIERLGGVEETLGAMSLRFDELESDMDALLEEDPVLVDHEPE